MKILFVLLLILGLFSCNQEQANPFGEGVSQGYLSQTTINGFPAIGLQIMEARLKKGLSEYELAEAIGLSDKNMKSIEKNLVVPTRDIMVAIQQVLETELILDAH